MKKLKKQARAEALTPEEGIDFLESFQTLLHGQDEPSQAISLRVPGNILRSYKLRAKADRRPYQSMMIYALREWLMHSAKPTQK